MTAPSQDTYLRTEQERRSRPSYGCQCGKKMFHNIAKPVTDFKRQINSLEKDLEITPIFFPCHKDDKVMNTALLISNRVVSWTYIFTKIISGRDPRFTSALWTNIHQLFGTKLSFSTAYHPQTDGLAERMIKTLEDMVRRVCEYVLELKACDGLAHYQCTLLPALKLAYKTSIHSCNNQTPAIVEKV
ncbi:hypothetical protein O181_005202 [Austropuccinia psidii MF-1]|uniref:Integrase catalytic domain-containing protein n=1 Tax=Austropuccinia psidii MF-1 TaxID=1389203 RepID=A0A9Q3BHN9_9BASI|nr:hypothetical protein [Austropuccinia psidii MF-1]